MDVKPDVSILFAHSVEEFQSRVREVSEDAWDRPTPCVDWDVRALVNHVVGEQRWVVPLLEGKTVAQVGNALDGDLLGEEPQAAAEQAGKEAVAAFTEPGALERTVHLSFGDFTAADYAWQMVADHVIHAWDLAVAVGADPHLDLDLVVRTSHWWEHWEAAYRDAGAVGPRFPLTAHASLQDRLISSFGRDPSWSAEQAAVTRFGAAWEAWDLDRITACLAEDAVFESTGPAPDGVRVEGRAAIRALWQDMFDNTRDPSFRFEETVVCGDRATARWRFSWSNEDGSAGHVRGVDVIRVANGQIAEKLSYVKG